MRYIPAICLLLVAGCGLEARMGTVESRMRDVQSEIGTLKVAVGDVHAEVGKFTLDGVNAELGTLKASLRDVQSEIGTLKLSIGDISTSVTGFDKRIKETVTTAVSGQMEKSAIYSGKFSGGAIFVTVIAVMLVIGSTSVVLVYVTTLRKKARELEDDREQLVGVLRENGGEQKSPKMMMLKRPMSPLGADNET